LLVALVVGAALLVVAPVASAASLTVNSTADTTDGQCDSSPNCTLREAILAANATTGKDTITFNIGTGTPSIAVGSSALGALPAITHPVTIDGSSGGATRIELNGAAAGTNSSGLTISGGNSTVSNLVINRFDRNGIQIDTAGGDSVVGCRLGTNAAGTAALANGGNGVLILLVSGNVIGGTTSDARNLLSGNTNSGVFILDGNGNVIEGNRIGTNAAGGGAVPNLNGVTIHDGSSNTVGGTAAGARNLVSGNSFFGVFLNDSGSGSTSGNVVQGNFIGTNAAGTAALANGDDGINLDGFVLTTKVGGTSAAARNVISGNGGDGVGVLGPDVVVESGHVVAGNYIGTDVTGAAALANSGAGVHINLARRVVVGGTAAGSGNVISGNHGAGVLVEDSTGPPEEALGTSIQGNLIGTNAEGTAGLGNLIGIDIVDQQETVIGGTTPAARNVVSGNAIGIQLAGATLGTVVQGNLVGTDVTGAAGIPNESDGIVIEYAQNLIGGTVAGAGNVIAFNGSSIVGGNGVLVKGGYGNSILGNSIFTNSLLGIDLGDDGVTPNDPGDADNGPNELQNFPSISSAKSNATTTHLVGKLSSTAGSRFLLEFYSSPSCDPSGNGEGKRFLGRMTLLTGPTGNGSFNRIFHIATPVGDRVTATATSPRGSTSEWSACKKVVSGS
jgi:titin